MCPTVLHFFFESSSLYGDGLSIYIISFFELNFIKKKCRTVGRRGFGRVFTVKGHLFFVGRL